MSRPCRFPMCFRYVTAALLLPTSLVLSASAAPLTDDTFCPGNGFPGFDSRLDVGYLGSIRPEDRDKVTGFEIVHGRPVVSLAHRLVFFHREGAQAVPVLGEIQGLAVDSRNLLLVQTRHGVLRLDDGRLVRDTAHAASGRLYGSGNWSFLDLARGDVGGGRLTIVTEELASIPFLDIEGTVHAVSWNRLGMAAVVGDVLMALHDGGSKLHGLARDSGLANARSVALVGENRAVVGLGYSTMLFSDKGVSIVVRFPALARWSDERLLLLDLRSGGLWVVEGIDRLGDPERDVAHARALLAGASGPLDESNHGYMEALRIVGCEEAQRWLPAPAKATSAR